MADFRTAITRTKKRFNRSKGSVIERPVIEMSPAVGLGSDNSYEQARNYIRAVLPKRFTEIKSSIGELVSEGKTFVVKGQTLEKNYHSVLIKAVDLKNLQELTLSDPAMEEALIKNIRVTSGNSALGLSDLRVITTRDQIARATGTFSHLRVNPTSPPLSNDVASEGYKLAKLQIIPLTDNIYMSLSRDGGFYVRNGVYLMPLVYEDTTEYLKVMNKIGTKEYIDDAAKNINGFNNYIQQVSKRVREGYRSPQTAVDSIKTIGSPKSTILFGRNPTQNPPSSTPNSQNSMQGNSQGFQGSGQSSLQTDDQSMASGRDSNFSSRYLSDQTALIFGFDRNTGDPFSSLNHSAPDYTYSYNYVKNKLPENVKKYYFDQYFDRDVLLTSAKLGRSPSRVNDPDFRNEILAIAGIPYQKKADIELAIINRFFNDKNTENVNTLSEAYNLIHEKPNLNSEWARLVKYPDLMNRYARDSDFQ